MISYWLAPQFVQVKNMQTVLNDLCIDLEVDLIDLKGKTRKREIVDKRHVALYVMNKYLGLTTVRAGELLNRDHASVIHACRKVEDLGLLNPYLQKYTGITLSDEKQIKNKY